MKTFTLSSLAALSLFALSVPVQAAGWTILPIVSDPAFKLEPTVALTLNAVKPDRASSASGAGLELNFNCGLLQSPDQRMRTHLNISRTDKNGTQATAIELSPRYTVPLGDGLSVGVGPSLGVFKVDNGITSKDLFGIGVAAGINYRAGQFFAGADVRYHSTTEKSGLDWDPTTVGMKVGVNF